MIRIISYIIFSAFTIATSLAQVKSEEIVINNLAIQLPGTLTYSQDKSPLIIWVHGSGGVDRNGNTPLYIKIELFFKGFEFFKITASVFCSVLCTLIVHTNGRL